MPPNYFTPNKSMKLVPGLLPGNFSRGTASLSRGEWLCSIKNIDEKEISKFISKLFGPEETLMNIIAFQIS